MSHAAFRQAFAAATGQGMICESCTQNAATYKFADSHLDDGQVKVVCPSCFYVLSVQCIRMDLTHMHQQLEAIQKKVGADLEG